MQQKIEKEAKFYIQDLKKVEFDLLALGAMCTQASVFELNLRFDTPDHKLAGSYQVLRLRKDTRVRLTYKGPADASSSVSARPELEVEISDLETGRQILEALGYETITVYEKFRASYQIGKVEVSLDRMPFGDFIEIEGSNETSIQLIAKKLGLAWMHRSSQSYMRLFSTVRQNLNLNFRDLTFDNFESIRVLPGHLQMQYAD